MELSGRPESLITVDNHRFNTSLKGSGVIRMQVARFLKVENLQLVVHQPKRGVVLGLEGEVDITENRPIPGWCSPDWLCV